jgi:hydroxyacylglutathione hydrolase
MKKLLKRISIIAGVVVLIAIILSGIYFYLVKLEIDSMTPVETGQLYGNVFTIKDSFTNMYIIDDSSGYIAVDAGNDIIIIEAELKKIGINADEVVALLLTHTDGDHVAAIRLFKNAKIYLSKDEERLINGEGYRFLIFGNNIDTDEYILLKDNQEFSIGETKIKGILTPGHTPGSMCYIINDSLLFTGDALSLKSGKVERFNELFNMDTDKAINSITNITHLPDVKYIFTAHHGISDDYNYAFEDWK